MYDTRKLYGNQCMYAHLECFRERECREMFALTLAQVRRHMSPFYHRPI